MIFASFSRSAIINSLGTKARFTMWHSAEKHTSYRTVENKSALRNSSLVFVRAAPERREREREKLVWSDLIFQRRQLIFLVSAICDVCGARRGYILLALHIWNTIRPANNLLSRAGNTFYYVWGDKYVTLSAEVYLPDPGSKTRSGCVRTILYTLCAD